MVRPNPLVQMDRRFVRRRLASECEILDRILVPVAGDPRILREDRC